MILYNITVILEETIETEWREWVTNAFIPNALSSNLLVSHRLLKVIDSPNEGVTYCMQFIADHLESYNQFMNNHAAALLSTHTQQFQNRAVFFSTVMEFIN
ncbi:MAG: DUF4286 family protein [Pyrinomonadaceae bacterium]|nr:DUF4286 family protein [Sphingobacteriaceae bacterium]